MIWGWDPSLTTQLRQSFGYTWVPVCHADSGDCRAGHYRGRNHAVQSGRPAPGFDCSVISRLLNRDHRALREVRVPGRVEGYYRQRLSRSGLSASGHSGKVRTNTPTIQGAGDAEINGTPPLFKPTITLPTRTWPGAPALPVANAGEVCPSPVTNI